MLLYQGRHLEAGFWGLEVAVNDRMGDAFLLDYFADPLALDGCGRNSAALGRNGLRLRWAGHHASRAGAF